MSDRILVATRKGLFDVRRRGRGWRHAPPALRGLAVAQVAKDSRDGSIWASLDHGHWGAKLARSADDGATYAETEPPKFPPETGKAVRYYWSLEPGPVEEPETFWIGTEPGGLFVTRDGGRTWSLVESLWRMAVAHRWMGGGRDEAGIHAITIDPREPGRLHVAVSCAGVIETTDGGATWTYRNDGVRSAMEPEEGTEHGHDPHGLARCAAAPDVLWQANHVGVYRSADAGRTWADLTQKPLVDFGFPVAAHPARPETAWIVPMESDARRVALDGALRVLRTDDGGSTWEAGTEGLPQEGAWDFPLRHGLAASADGERLALGTTSGNLFVSEDGGRSWQALAHHLPLVYAVRFA